jgi:hypothetical protein
MDSELADVTDATNVLANLMLQPIRAKVTNVSTNLTKTNWEFIM